MKAEKFLVTTRTANGRDRADVWDTSSPMGLGFPFKYVMERTAAGVMVRSLGGSVNQVQVGAAVLVDEQTLLNGAEIELPGTRTKVRLRLVRPIRAAYLPDPVAAREASEGKLPAILAFSGMRRVLLGCTAIHSAYVAYSRGRPLFTVYHSPEGYRIKPLLSGVALKLKNQKPLTGKPGEAWQLTTEQFLGATVLKGYYWWRFSLVPALSGVLSRTTAAEIDQEGFWFKRAMMGVAGVLGLLCLVTLVWPARPLQTEEEKKPAPIVNFRPKLLRKVSTPPPVPESVPLAKEAPAESVKPAPAPAPAKEALSPPTKTLTKELAAQQAKAKASAAQARALRDLLGGAKALVKKSVEGVKAESPSASKEALNMFRATDKSALAPTEIKPGFTGTKVKVEAMGGSSMGGSASGYSSGEHAKVSGQGKSLVSMDQGGSVVEEGLTKEEVGKVIHAHMGEVRYCYEAALLYQPKIEGKLQVQFTITSNGSVKKASVQSSSLPEKSLEGCIVGKLKGWEFPKPKGKIDVTVSYPFLFKTLGRDGG